LFSCATLLVAVISLGSCDNAAKPDITPDMWTRVPLAGSEGAVLRDVTFCDGEALVVGGKNGGPAAWRRDEAIPFKSPAGSYYGPREQINSVACVDGRVAMVGAVPGGAHGNPRVSTWRLDGTQMRENAAPFETYGGDEAVDVGGVEVGPAGFAIAGNRTGGAAAWYSSDGVNFRLDESRRSQGLARDAVALPDGRWMVVGGRAVPGSADQQPAAWIGSQPTGPSAATGFGWQPADPPAATGYNELQRAVRQGDDIISAGMRGTHFAIWRRHAGTWTLQDTYEGGDPGGVRSLAVAGEHVALVGGGLWIDGRKIDGQKTGWRNATPIAVAGNGNVLLMVTADGLWRATLS
jgi:hypothetical protein